MTKQFASDLDAFLALNAFRVVCCSVAWLIAVTDLAPGVVRAAAQAEHAARLHLDAQIAAKRPAGRGVGGGFGSADLHGGAGATARGAALMAHASERDTLERRRGMRRGTTDDDATTAETPR